MKAGILEKYINLYGKSLKAVCEAYQFSMSVGETPEKAVPINERTYLCPLCIKNIVFVRNNQYSWNKDFTLDHFPPKSVGGRQKMLVCDECNSTYGRNWVL